MPSLTLPSAATHLISSAQVVEAGHEKRASMQRTALGRGEQAYCGASVRGSSTATQGLRLMLTALPVPVELLMQVWPGAQEMPFRQSTPVGMSTALEMMVGMAWAQQSRARTKTSTVKDFMIANQIYPDAIVSVSFPAIVDYPG